MASKWLYTSFEEIAKAHEEFLARPKPKVTLTLDEWTQYRDVLRKLNEKAADEFRDAVWNINGKWKGIGLGFVERDDIIYYAYELVTKYSEGATEAACEFYDAIAELSGAKVPPAVPAETATLDDVQRTLHGVVKQSQNEDVIANALGRLVKQAGQDTTLLNAARDGAEFAWIPHGETCAFCLTLASRGWQHISKRTLKNGHAEHIHANCDCAYCVRFDDTTTVEGYNPDAYLRMYYAADGNTPKQRINAMRRDFYAEKKEEINKQKRDAYEKRKELNSSSAEETDVS